MCFFSEIEKCLRRTAVYKESVIFYGFNFSPAFCVPISESKEWGGPFNILLSGGDTSSVSRQGPRLSIRIDIWILPSDTIRE